MGAYLHYLRRALLRPGILMQMATLNAVSHLGTKQSDSLWWPSLTKDMQQNSFCVGVI